MSGKTLILRRNYLKSNEKGSAKKVISNRMAKGKGNMKQGVMQGKKLNVPDVPDAKSKEIPEKPLLSYTNDQLKDIIGAMDTVQQQQSSSKDPPIVQRRNEDAEELKYNRYDKGPFITMIEKEELGLLDTAKEISAVVGRAQVEEIKKISKSRVKVTTRTWDAANLLVSSAILKQKYKIYIPSIYLETVGVIDNIPISFDEEDLISEMETGTHVTKIERMIRFDQKTKSLTQMDKVKIHFRSYTLPRAVKIFGASFRVRLFVPNPTYCKQCLSYGHFKKICRNPERCQNCSEERSDDHECISNCKFCQDCTHRTNDRKCKEKKKQILIKTKMIENKCSYPEALKLVTQDSNQIDPARERDEHFRQTMAQTVELGRRFEELKTKNDNLIDLIQTLTKIAFEEKRDGKVLIEDIRDIIHTNLTLFTTKD